MDRQGAIRRHRESIGTKLYTVNEFAEYVQVSRSKAYDIILKSGEIEFFRINGGNGKQGQIRLTRWHIQEWIKKGVANNGSS